MLLDSGLNIIDASLFSGITDMMILVTVTLFSFNTGISIDLRNLVENLGKAVAFAFTSFIAITAMIGYSLSMLFPLTFSLQEGLLMGSMIGGIGGISITGLLGSYKKLFKNIGNSGILLSLESSLSDPLRIVAVITLIKMITLSNITYKTGVKDVFFTFVVSILLGLFAGLFWGGILNRLRNKSLNYMMTIAFLFPVNILVERIAEGGGGPIAVMVTGIVLMNYGYITRRIGWKGTPRVSGKQIRQYHEEITFLVKSLFFVYLGMIFNVKFWSSIIAFGAILIIFIVRYSLATGVGRLLGLPKREIIITRLTFIQGVGVMVLAQLPSQYDPTLLFFKHPEVFTDVGIPIVFFSILFSSILSPEVAKRQIKKSEYSHMELVEPELAEPYLPVQQNTQN
jgi:cell volume regulation protein A